jgi:DNA-binding winged helix-turn-helix (wHTH) protein
MRYFGDFSFDEKHGLLWQDGVRIPLTAKAAGVLNCLLTSPDHLATKEEILRSVWPDTHVAPDNVKVLIREVRHALRDDARAPRFIRTIVRGTYAFVAPVHNAQPSSGPERDGTFCGRREEFSVLESAILTAAEHPSLIVVNGPSGIGKTTLAERVLHAVERHGRLVARGQSILSSVPGEHYGVLLDTLGRLMIEVPRVREIIQPHAPTVVQLMQQSAAGSARATAAPTSLLRELIAAFEAISQETPLVLALEDVQWLDDGDVDVIGALVRRRRAPHLTILVTSRPLDTTSARTPLRRLIAELQIARLCVVLDLGPFSHSEIAQYAHERFGKNLGPQLSPFLDAITGGQPLLLRTIADTLFQKGAVRNEPASCVPTSSIADVTRVAYQAVSFVLARQMELISTEDQRLLKALSHLGLEFPVTSALGVGNGDPDAVETQLEMLVKQGELITLAPHRNGTRDGTWFRFTNTAYRDLLAGAPGAARTPMKLAASNPFLHLRRRRPVAMRARTERAAGAPLRMLRD